MHARRRKLAVKVLDIFGNDTMTIVEVNVGKNGGKKKWRKKWRKQPAGMRRLSSGSSARTMRVWNFGQVATFLEYWVTAIIAILRG
jgi:transposase